MSGGVPAPRASNARSASVSNYRAPAVEPFGDKKERDRTGDPTWWLLKRTAGLVVLRRVRFFFFSIFFHVLFGGVFCDQPGRERDRGERVLLALSLFIMICIHTCISRIYFYCYILVLTLISYIYLYKDRRRLVGCIVWCILSHVYHVYHVYQYNAYLFVLRHHIRCVFILCSSISTCRFFWLFRRIKEDLVCLLCLSRTVAFREGVILTCCALPKRQWRKQQQRCHRTTKLNARARSWLMFAERHAAVPDSCSAAAVSLQRAKSWLMFVCQTTCCCQFAKQINA